MRRVRAEALALVNWKGVFYERYLLHEQVTALEGANGSGKTTVMIAAYVVLLPDMARLRFTNLGETSALGGDRGIYGRLGEPGRPSYAVLDLRLPEGERLLAGVLLERRAEPSVELNPFLITGLADGVALQDLLLDRGDRDEVPDRVRLRALVNRAGGRLEFLTARDYFARLFEAGVTPLRLSVEGERTKFGEMLRTSMVGGISRALTGGLRDFLLKEETGLADTLQRMRGNLDACHRTRLQVGEARLLEAEIHGVYEAGQGMFTAALHAGRELALEWEGRAREARERAEQAAAAHAEVLRERDETQVLLEEARAHSMTAAAELEALKGRRERTRRGNEADRRRRGLETERSERLEARAAAARAEMQAEERLALRQGALRQAQERYESAARGLADFQSGFEELVRRAASYHEAKAALERAGAVLGPVQVHLLAEARAEVATRLGELDRDCVRLEREVATAARRREEFGCVLGALERLSGTSFDEPYEGAREVLAGLRRLEDLARRMPELARRRDEARRLAGEQARAREAAGRLGLASGAEVAGALDEVESRLTDLADGRSAKEAEGREAGRLAREAGARATELEGQRQRWRSVSREAAELAARWSRPVAGREDLDDLAGWLQEERDQARASELQLTSRLEALSAEIHQLQQSGGRFPEELLRTRDLLEGELLAGRFEDVDLAEAARLQARLGPLHEALLVEDVEAAARVLASHPEAPSTVWLVDGSSALPTEGEELEGSVVVPGPVGWRVTRIPEAPVLGRRARERRLHALRGEVKTLEYDRESVQLQLRRLGMGIQDAQALLPEAAILEEGDPTPRLEEARALEARQREAQAQAQAEFARLEGELARVRARREELRRLLPVAHLLDEADQAELLRQVETELEEARRGRERLAATAADRRTVEVGLEALRVPPPGPAELDALRAARADAEAERDRLSGAARDLRHLEENREALAWEDAGEALRERKSLAPALEEQVSKARQALDRANAEEAEARKLAAEAQRRVVSEDGRLEGLESDLQRVVRELETLACEDPSDEALAALEETTRSAEEACRELAATERKLDRDFSRLEERLGERARHAELRAREAAEAEALHAPAREAWESLEAASRAGGVLDSESALASVQGKGSLQLWQEAETWKRLLVERLERASDGEALLASVRSGLEAVSQHQRAEACLAAWLEVRDWLRRRMPPSIAEVDEPLEALRRLREHLERLEERLALQERELRGSSADIARNIETQIRKARRTVERLNHDLRDVRFGSIRSVQLKVQSQERMWQVLEALKEPEVQGLLFDAEMPVDQALEEMFRRYGGGRTGGHRLLDYREYVELRVEVQRTTGAAWEEANPTKMSTGEAIGVGAAVMIVVLTAWERDANLFRASRSAGTLRLLFLDEANRLSQDSLGVLFDLCQELDLQLILAAPEVARAEGNTTYRLVRRVDASGREEVVVTGRRAVPLQAALF